MSTTPNNKIFQSIAASAQNHEAAFKGSFVTGQISILEQIAVKIEKALKSGNKILLCGNGGSAADAQHIAAEFIGRFRLERKSLPAIALTTDTSILTAVGNDYSYEDIFSRQVEGLGRSDDILIGISTSGNSKNVLKAVQAAKSCGLFAIGFTGQTGGALKKLVDLNFEAQSTVTSHIQEMHITALHAVSEAVENAMFRV